jgi:GT2 family glycosyltransferase
MIERLFRKKTDIAADLALLAKTGFDPNYYVLQVDSTGFGNMPPLEHYHRIGWKSGLNPSPWFCVRSYLLENPDVSSSGMDPFLHYARYGKAEARQVRQVRQVGHGSVSPAEAKAPTIAAAVSDVASATSSHAQTGSRNRPRRDEIEIVRANIDEAFYIGQLPHHERNERTSIDAAEHYVLVGHDLGLDPAPDFSTRAYLTDHGDVALVGENAFVHFIRRGAEEKRVTRYSENGRGNGGDGKSEWYDYHIVRQRGREVLDHVRARPELLDFTVTLAGAHLARALHDERLRKRGAQPRVSVVVPAWNEEVVTAECLMSLFRCSDECALQIIVVDNGSKDRLYGELEDHPDLQLITLPENIGFGPASNLGASKATGDFVLFLNNDAQIAPGALTAMIAALEDDSTAAVCGPKILSFDGRLQEAGAFIRSDGFGHLIGFASDPETPRFSYRRKVEHLSGAALLVRREILEEVGGFDDAFAPAYCEDADLSLRLRRAGYSLVYEPNALVAHHLSKSSVRKDDDGRQLEKLKLVGRNRAKLIERWADDLLKFDIRTIAFYLPQYHPIPQNDLWWGKGFTDWRNLGNAKPKFAGHRQPRVPADLGYYDLRRPEVMQEQADLASRYGISGFCYYYYRFGEERILEGPLETMLRTGRPAFPFCLCWANENWSRRWDGMDADILKAQNYSESDACGFAEDVARYFASDQYITVDGKPLILFYRLQEIRFSKRYVETCRNVWNRLGFPDVVVAMVESFELSAAPQRPEKFGADITVEFPAHGMVNDPATQVRRLDTDWVGNAHDYRELARAFMVREEAGFKRFRSVLVGWDTTPRHPTRSLVLEHSTPGALQAWLEWTYLRTREQNFGDERLVFVNAWNEWCEGSYLEPDMDYGHGFLQAIKNAQETAAVGVRCFA